jgi:hypothetical protein
MREALELAIRLGRPVTLIKKDESFFPVSMTQCRIVYGHRWNGLTYNADKLSAEYQQ